MISDEGPFYIFYVSFISVFTTITVYIILKILSRAILSYLVNKYAEENPSKRSESLQSSD